MTTTQNYSTANRILITNNYDISNNINRGTNFVVNTNIFSSKNSDNSYKITTIENNQTNFKNKIILSAEISSSNSNSNNNSIKNVTLITQKQLLRNIKLIYLNNNFNNQKLVFYNNNFHKSIDSDKNYFLSVKSNDENETEYIINNKIINNKSTFHIGFNLYKSFGNSDYYKINFKDFLSRNFFVTKKINNSDLVNIKYKVNNIKLENDFSNNILVNYNEDIFKSFLYKNNTYFEKRNIDNGLNETTINDNKFYYLYNKYRNNTILDVKIKYDNNTTLNKDLSINFNVVKFKNYNFKFNNKILLYKDYISLNGYCFTKDVNEDLIKSFYDKLPSNSYNNRVFLSMGNGIIGLNRRDFFNNIRIKKSENANKIFGNKIFFKQEIKNNYNGDNNNDDLYLVDSSSDYVNKIDIQKNIPKDKNTELPIKIFDLSINNYININNYNYEISNNYLFNNNNNNDLLDITKKDNNNIYSIDNSNTDILLYENSGNSENDNFRLKLNNNYYKSLKTILDNKITYDFRYNYDKDATLLLNLDISYNQNIYNFNKIQVINNFKTSSGSDFTNVDCIFRYHDPDDNSTPNEFKYPNNNIEIIRDVTIDNLSKAIELLPNSRTGTSNSIFLPGRNGSNLSRKMIQGYIGMNNIPKLLSIKPYDPNVINNRGFNNQLNFQGGKIDAQTLALTDDDRVLLKYNSQKHFSQKNKNKVLSNKNFASIVNNPNRNKNINLNSQLQPCENNINNVKKNQYITPFRLFKTGKGNYLNSG